jgi:hypothetical protein
LSPRERLTLTGQGRAAKGCTARVSQAVRPFQASRQKSGIASEGVNPRDGRKRDVTLPRRRAGQISVEPRHVGTVLSHRLPVAVARWGCGALISLGCIDLPIAVSVDHRRNCLIY